MRSRADSFKVALEASLLALAVTLGFVESVLIPPLPVPGMRLGLANLAVVIALAALGSAAAIRISIVRVLLVGLAAGTLAGPTGLMSLAGASAAVLSMCLLARTGGARFSVVGWSLTGSAAHVIGQTVAACAIAGTAAPALLLPTSLILSILSGLAIGYSARSLLSRIPSRNVSFA